MDMETTNKSIELESTQLHPEVQHALLSFIARNFKDWFTPEDVYEKLKKLSPKEIGDFCGSVSHHGWFRYGEYDGQKWTRFKIGFMFLKS